MADSSFATRPSVDTFQILFAATFPAANRSKGFPEARGPVPGPPRSFDEESAAESVNRPTSYRLCRRHGGAIGSWCRRRVL